MAETKDSEVFSSVVADEEAKEAALERLLSLVDGVAGVVPLRVPEPVESRGLRIAQVVKVGTVGVVVDCGGILRPASLAAHVELDYLRVVAEENQPVLVEIGADGAAVLVGALQSRFPRKLSLRAEEIELIGSRELTLKSGKAAMRMKEDGSVDLVGTRIGAVSRGLLRLVGRALRLN